MNSEEEYIIGHEPKSLSDVSSDKTQVTAYDGRIARVYNSAIDKVDDASAAFLKGVDKVEDPLLDKLTDRLSGPEKVHTGKIAKAYTKAMDKTADFIYEPGNAFSKANDKVDAFEDRLIDKLARKKKS